jgi:integrase
MGRRASSNLNLPPHMRKRVRGVHTYYYFDTGDKPRKEIALGTDYFIALKKYAELALSQRRIGEEVKFGDALLRYMTEVVPTLSVNSQHTFRSDAKHVGEFFNTAPMDQIRPMHIRQFLDRHKATPTTANRCKRLFSTVWNHARGWGYTDAQNPCEGVTGYSLPKRTVYISDRIFAAVYAQANAPLRDAMDLAYLTGQRPADALLMSEHDIVEGHLVVTQVKTKHPLRIVISGKLAQLIDRIHERKSKHKVVTAALLVNEWGKRLTAPALRNQFVPARKAAAIAQPELASEIKKFWFYDLRAKAADDTSDQRGEQAASNLLGHENVKTTQRHYLRRGRIVPPTK